MSKDTKLVFKSLIADETKNDALKDDFYEAEENFEEKEKPADKEINDNKSVPVACAKLEPSNCCNKDVLETDSKDTVDCIEEAINQSESTECNEALCDVPPEPAEDETSSQKSRSSRKKGIKSPKSDSLKCSEITRSDSLKCSEIAILAGALRKKQREYNALAAKCYEELATAQEELDEIEAENEELKSENEMLKDLLEYILSEAMER